MRKIRDRLVSRRSNRGGLRLTSMMDILVVLLLFMLKSFVAEGEAMTPMAGVQLPSSTSRERPEASLVIAISDDAILFAGESITSVREALAGDGLQIEALADRLARARARSIEIGRRQGRDSPPPRTVTVQGDRDINFGVLQRVMYTCRQSGYENISLAVIQSS